MYIELEDLNPAYIGRSPAILVIIILMILVD
jgi:hypothetical protein